MDKTAWLELLLAGFFAIGRIRSHGRFEPGRKMRFLDFCRLAGRLERLRGSRWQWFSMVAIMLLLRLQHQLPPAVESLVWMMFLVTLIVPVQALVGEGR